MAKVERVLRDERQFVKAIHDAGKIFIFSTKWICRNSYNNKTDKISKSLTELCISTYGIVYKLYNNNYSVFIGLITNLL